MSKRDIPNVAELEELQKKVSKLSSQLEVAEQARDKNAADLKAKTAELEELRKTIDEEVKKSMAPKLAELEELRKKNTELRTANNELTSTNNGLKAANAELTTKLAKAMELLKELEELKKKNEELMERVEAKKAEAAPAKRGSTTDPAGYFTPEEWAGMCEDADAALVIKSRMDSRKKRAADRGDMMSRLAD